VTTRSYSSRRRRSHRCRHLPGDYEHFLVERSWQGRSKCADEVYLRWVDQIALGAFLISNEVGMTSVQPTI